MIQSFLVTLTLGLFFSSARGAVLDVQSLHVLPPAIAGNELYAPLFKVVYNGRHYVVDLEAIGQSKHDYLLAGYCKQHNRGTRKSGPPLVMHEHRTAEEALSGYYLHRGWMCLLLVEEHMSQNGPNTGSQVNLCIQEDEQVDGHQYEVSYYIDPSTGEIYVFFHCYPEESYKKNRLYRLEKHWRAQSGFPNVP